MKLIRNVLCALLLACVLCLGTAAPAATVFDVGGSFLTGAACGAAIGAIIVLAVGGGGLGIAMILSIGGGGIISGLGCN